MARAVVDSADSAGTSQAKMQSKRPVSAGRDWVFDLEKKIAQEDPNQETMASWKRWVGVVLRAILAEKQKWNFYLQKTKV